MQGADLMNEINISDIIKSLIKYKMVVIIITLAGFLAGFIFTANNYLEYKNVTIYSIEASMSVITEEVTNVINSEGKVDRISEADVYLAQKLADSAAFLARSDRVVSAVLEKTGVNASVSQVKDRITVTPYNSTQILTVTFQWPDVEQGKRILTELMDELSDAMIDTLHVGSVNIIDYPREAFVTPYRFDFINMAIFTGIAFLIGCMAATILGILRPTYRTPNEIRDTLTLDTIGEIPHFTFAKKGKRDNTNTFRFEEAIRILSSVYRFVLDNNNAKCVYVTSAAQGEGKSTIAVDIAITLASMNKKVLLMDFDLRRPVLGKYFNIDKNDQRSVENVLQKKITLLESIIKIKTNLDIVKSNSYNDRLDFTGISEQLNNIRAAYDYIICDTAPIGVVSDALMLNSVCDGAILVIKQESTLMDVVYGAVDTLNKAGTKILGCVLNDIDKKGGSYKYYRFRYDNYYKNYVTAAAEADTP